MMTTQDEVQMFGMASKAVRRDWEASGSRLQDHNSMQNLSNSPVHRQRFAAPRKYRSFESTQALYHESELPKSRARRASAPACVVLQKPLQMRPHDQARLGASERATKASGSNRPLRSRRSPPTLRIITSRGDLFCSDDTPEISSIAHLSSRSHVYHSSGTEMTDVVRVTPSTSLGEPFAGFPRARSPAQGVEALEGDLLLLPPSASARSLKQQGAVRDPPQVLKAESSWSPPRSVDRLDSPSSTVMTVSKSPRNVKASRRHLFIDLNEHKRQSLLQYDDNESHDLNEHCNSGSKPSSPISSKPSSPVSLRHPQFRTLRRKKHFDIARSRSDQDEPTPEPIAISLTLRSPAAPKSPAPSIPKQSSHTHSRKQSDPQSIATASDSTTCTTPPSPRSPEILTPPQTSIPFEPSTSPTGSFSAAPGSSPFTAWTPSWSPTSVKFGHPSRPYYTAIRKQGISPPSSRPPSTSGFTSSSTRPSSPPSSRPKSSPPPPLSVPASSNTAARHLSLSAMPPRHMGFVSAFSLELEDSDDDEDPLPLPPTPAPIPANFSFGQSLASAAKRLSSRKSYANLLGRGSHPPPSSLPAHQHSQSHSMSYSLMEVSGSSVVSGGSPTRSGFRVGSPAIGLGFSMSGETELRLALARADAEAENGTSDDGEFSSPSSPLSYQTTPAVSRPSSPPVPERIPPPTAFPSSSSRPNLDTKMSFRSRVKKLRKGLKHMLMNTHTDLNTMHNTMNTATPATISNHY
ncbi:hypothetical protein CPB83DRAFT_864897 [Crepidotus variabilis]|uniref:Uncharacterized protein n=1 Tax=Crepidotus variabilis TaxID=179855 RepID=A0A9P6E439_9AGAR|nr:hypothetical protein CPB83DRAFT_864897 [Crepidotus variabilis]